MRNVSCVDEVPEDGTTVTVQDWHSGGHNESQLWDVNATGPADRGQVQSREPTKKCGEKQAWSTSIRRRTQGEAGM